MRLLFYNIQDPLDPQVNGFGLYRGAVNGVVELLIAKKSIGGRSTQFPSVEFSLTQPWEASDCTNEELVPVWANPSQMIFGTDTDPSACTGSQLWEIEPYNHLNSEDTYRATQPWELDFFSPKLKQSHITWAFSSTMEDSALGSQVEFDNDPPLGNHLVASFQEHMFVAGDPLFPHYLYFSKRFRPESFPTDQFIEIGTANDPLTVLVPLAGLLGTFTRDTKYRVSGNATTGFTHHEAISRRGTSAYKSVVPSDKGIIFVNRDGVYTTNLIGPDNKISDKIESLFTGDTVSDELPINQAAIDQIAAAYYKHKYYFTYPTGTATAPSRMAVYSFDTQEWTIFALGGGSMLYESDTDALVLGGNDSFVYVMESGHSDDGSAISAEMRSKDFAGASYNTNNLFLYLKIDAEVANGTSLVAQFFVDDQLRHTVTLTYVGSRVNTFNPLPEGTFGARWRVRITLDDVDVISSGTKLYGVAAVFLPLASS